MKNGAITILTVIAILLGAFCFAADDDLPIGMINNEALQNIIITYE